MMAAFTILCEKKINKLKRFQSIEQMEEKIDGKNDGNKIYIGRKKPAALHIQMRSMWWKRTQIADSFTAAESI